VVGYGWSKVLLAVNSELSSSRDTIWTLLLYSSTKLPKANLRKKNGYCQHFAELLDKIPESFVWPYRPVHAVQRPRSLIFVDFFSFRLCSMNGHGYAVMLSDWKHQDKINYSIIQKSQHAYINFGFRHPITLTPDVKIL
jgi:hypothetical protein